jgi:hypothetical protein
MTVEVPPETSETPVDEDERMWMFSVHDWLTIMRFCNIEPDRIAKVANLARFIGRMSDEAIEADRIERAT